MFTSVGGGGGGFGVNVRREAGSGWVLGNHRRWEIFKVPMGKSTETQVNGTSPPFLMNLGVTRSIDCRQPLANSSYQHRSKIENNRKLV